MPDNYNQDNLNRWIEGADIDYFTHFIRAWIPFNAWYKHSFHTVGDGSDRTIINHIKNNTNEIRNAIENYLILNGGDNDIFKSHLAGLHHELQRTTLENSNERISFESIVLSVNSTNQIVKNIRGIRYFLKRTDGVNRNVTRMQCVITNNNGNICNYDYTDYNAQHFLNHPEFDKLKSAVQKENARLFFEELNHLKPTRLLVHERDTTEANSFNCLDINFIRDENNAIHPAETISKGVIEIIYRLRNVLFHGELNPTGDSKLVYKNAYNILRMLIERIR